MSADNGVYIGRFTKSDGFEYRVIHAQAIENCDYDKSFPEKLTQAYRVVYYGESKIYDNEGAGDRALELHKEILEGSNQYSPMDVPFPVCEYGISEIQYDEPFPEMTVEEAVKFIDDEYWKEEQKQC